MPLEQQGQVGRLRRELPAKRFQAQRGQAPQLTMVLRLFPQTLPGPRIQELQEREPRLQPARPAARQPELQEPQKLLLEQ